MTYAVFAPGSHKTLGWNHTVYATAHDAALGTMDNGIVYQARNSFITTYYGISRGVSRYNTSSIGAATITAARLHCAIYTFYTVDGTQHHIHLVEGNQTEPVQYPDYGLLLTQTVSGGEINSADIQVDPHTGNAFEVLELNATGLTWINKTGYTPLACRTEGDINSQTPTGANGSGSLGFLTTICVTDAATSISNTMATLNAYALHTGLLEVEHDGAVPTYPRWRFQYGKVSGVWDNATDYQYGLRACPDVTADIASLETGTTYYFRVERDDTDGTSYGSILNFTTNTIYPSEAITRVTNIIHRYSKEGQVYTMELNLGGVTSELGIPEWADRPMYAITPRTEAPAPPNLFEPYIPDVPAPTPSPTPTPIPGQITCPYDGMTFDSYLDYGIHYALYHAWNI